MTWRASLTDKQKMAVEEFRELMAPNCSSKLLEDETVFYRFMKARDFNVQNATQMLKKHIAWRKEYQVDSILTDYTAPETIIKYTAITELGFDKEGAIVKHVDIGRSDFKGVLRAVKKIDIIKYNLQVYERDLIKLKEHNQKIGKNCNQIVYIHNFDKMTLAKATNKKALEFIIFTSKMYQDNYPEQIKTMFVINASMAFKIFYSVLRTCLAAPLVEKIRFHGTVGYKEGLLDIIDASVLPAFLGGNRTDPSGDPCCSSFMLWGETIPEELYLPANERVLSSLQEAKNLSVPARSRTELEFPVKEEGSVLEWEFQTNGDIGFGLEFRSPRGRGERLVPVHRCDTSSEPEEGIYKCDETGTYILVFDNSYSWFYSKDVFYRTTLRSSEEEKPE